MELIYKRSKKGHKTFIGDFYNEQGHPMYVMLEDLNDAFPEGYYELKIRYPEEDGTISGLTKKYRSSYSWFKNHIEICSIGTDSLLDRDHIYIHVGNKPEDTEGCLLIGLKKETDYIYNSLDAYKSFYLKYYELLDSGVRIFFSVENCY